MSTTVPERGAERGTALRTLSNYIGGRWVEARSDDLLDVTNPATGATLARVPLSGEADVDAAVAAALAAFPGWRATPTIERARMLFDLRQRLVERQAELAAQVTTEMGKTLPDASAEVARMIEMVECACAIPTTMQGRNLENVSRAIDCETYRQPIGVFAAIVPFNFPAMVPMWFLPFAIACGNTFVLKPSEQVPLTQTLVFEILDGLGLPEGVVNLVHGSRAVVERLCDHPDVSGVSFVGSAKVAKLVYTRAAAAGKRVQALGGAKNHMVVMPDAHPQKTIDGIIGSAFGAAGQRCMAGSVLVTVGEAHDTIVPGLIEKAAALKVGDGLEAGTAMGPLVSCDQRDRVAAWIDRGEQEGARVALDGRPLAGSSGAGAFLGPTILDDVAPEMEVAREEIFGPVLSVIRVKSLDEAIDVVNRSRYGNGTSIFTESGAAARRYRHDVEVGMVGVNVGVAAPVAFFPFSGWKDSFFGDLHAHGTDAVDFFTRKTTVTSRWFSGGETGRFFVEG
jgi:malonate-semialdehyde dehydrogenase (acetylating)/methylmalonate-semialdehyde dehydrogenase